ncbi:ATP-binding cassette domain-containing protein [Streptomyces sp. So13.3]|uniref:ATP-binding cassette domain-containing protein n=1 Tax=Streptomyces sp. So13.3 TaxID=2136173 RepID=UPI001105B1A4|nr:ATP-binding cassette domain-containing protein [Streptomyces sp. So13.3]QNA78383.1 ATP-binding cassette domain-containing protein [Streptomyces sp. So13.3]
MTYRTLTFDIPRGETFGCLGRNGAGKTTLINLLTTLETPTSGSAQVCGHDVVRERTSVRARIGASLQQVALDELMTGREHLAFIGRLAGLSTSGATARAEELIDLFGLGSAMDKVVAVCSGGTRRRLDLALALMRDPDVLFLDEPTTGLDPQSRRALWGWVRAFAVNGGTVLLTTQYLEEADVLADRIAVMDRGRVAVLDTPRRLKARYGGKRVQVRPTDGDEHLRVLAEFGPSATAGPDGVTLDAAAPGLLLKTIDRLACLGVPETAYSIEEPTLEDVFVRLTGSAPATDGEAQTAAGLAALGRSLATTRGKGNRT